MLNLSVWCKVHHEVLLSMGSAFDRMIDDAGEYIVIMMSTATYPRVFLERTIDVRYLGYAEEILEMMYREVMSKQKKEELRIENDRLNSMNSEREKIDD